MKIGDTVTASVWITGEEPPALRKRYEKDVTGAIDYLCHEKGFTHGPVRWIEKTPLDEGVPEVPDHIQGIDVKLLIAEADVTGLRQRRVPGAFLMELEPDDLQRLRLITHRVYHRLNPDGTKRKLTDIEVDETIDEIGPEVALELLRREAAGETIH